MNSHLHASSGFISTYGGLVGGYGHFGKDLNSKGISRLNNSQGDPEGTDLRVTA